MKIWHNEESQSQAPPPPSSRENIAAHRFLKTKKLGTVPYMGIFCVLGCGPPVVPHPMAALWCPYVVCMVGCAHNLCARNVCVGTHVCVLGHAYSLAWPTVLALVDSSD